MGILPLNDLNRSAPSTKRVLDWRQVRILYVRELRAALREKAIVLNSILIPTFLYPFLLWLVLTGAMFVSGQSDKFPSRVAVSAWPEGHPKLRNSFQRDKQIQLLENPGSPAELEQKVRLGQLDAVLQFLPPTNPAAAALPGNFQAQLAYTQARERSRSAHSRITDLLEEYREGWIQREGRKLGVSGPAWQGFTLATRNVASDQQMGRFILGLVAPIIFVVMVAVGTFYPAIDAIAGERERNTWETLMSSAASRVSIVTAKYLYVTTLGGLAGLLNLLAVMLTLKPVFEPLFAQAGKTVDCTIPLTALPIAVVVAVLLAGFVAAGMMLFAAFARTFKEGQAMTTPFYLLVILPVVFFQAPGAQFTLALACVPVVNLTLVMREALSGIYHWPQIGLALAASLVLIGAAIRLAAFILQFEDVVMGSYAGNFARFFQQRLLKRAPANPSIPEVKS